MAKGRELELRDTRKFLTAAMRRGAYLEAQGKTRAEIAEIVGVVPETVSTWRQERKYHDEIQRWIGSELQPFEQQIQLALVEWVDVIELARERLLALLVAERENGEPNTGAQLEALKIVANHPATKRLLGVPEGPQGGGQPVNQTVTLHVHRSGDVETLTVIEGEFEEVTENEHREGSREAAGESAAGEAAGGEAEAGEDD